LSREIDKYSLGLDIGASDCVYHPFLKLNKLISIYFTNYSGINIICNLDFGIPFRSQIFDFILMPNLLQHLYTDKVLTEVNRLLKKV